MQGGYTIKYWLMWNFITDEICKHELGQAAGM